MTFNLSMMEPKASWPDTLPTPISIPPLAGKFRRCGDSLDGIRFTLQPNQNLPGNTAKLPNLTVAKPRLVGVGLELLNERSERFLDRPSLPSAARSQSLTRVLLGGMECQCLARSRSSIRAKLSPLPETRILDRDSALRQSNRMAKEKSVIPIERIAALIYVIRGESVMLDAELAELYHVETGALVRAMKRNLDRFPKDFAFQLTKEEFDNLRSQTGISSWGG